MGQPHRNERRRCSGDACNDIRELDWLGSGVLELIASGGPSGLEENPVMMEQFIVSIAAFAGLLIAESFRAALCMSRPTSRKVSSHIMTYRHGGASSIKMKSPACMHDHATGHPADLMLDIFCKYFLKCIIGVQRQ